MSDLDDVHRLAAIHRLVDDLPKEALDATFRVLENYAKWPPKGHADAERMLGQARERFLKKYEERDPSVSPVIANVLGPCDNHGCTMSTKTLDLLVLMPVIPLLPVKAGYLRSIFLHIDYAAKSITGRRPDNSIFKVQSGDPIHIPGDTTAATGGFAVLVPEIQFTVTMSGTRHGVIPDGFQVPDPPMPQVVAGAAGMFG